MSLDNDHCGECAQDPCVCVGPLDLHEDTPKPNPLKRSYANVGQPRDPVFESSQMEDDEDPLVEEDDDGDAELLSHHRGYQKKFKQALICSESYSPEPDLDAYFDVFHLSAQQKIAMCRTYANYLTQKLRSSGKLAPARIHKKY